MKTPIAIMKAYQISDSRVCTKCLIEKPFSSFSKCSRERLGIRSQCKECVSEGGKSAYWSDRDRQIERGRSYSSKNRGKCSARLAKWRKENAEKDRAIAADWRKRNPDKIRATSQRHYDKKRLDPKIRLQMSVKAMVFAGIKPGAKNRRKTFSFLGYSPSDLRSHLEKRFLPGMAWDNYGKVGWEVDHVIPLSVFNYETPDDLDFKRAWALSNLQPLWGRDNRMKSAKLSKPFQPSLLIGAPGI